MIIIKNTFNLFNLTIINTKIHFQSKKSIKIYYERDREGYKIWAVNNSKENISLIFEGIRPKQSLSDLFHDKKIIRSEYNKFGLSKNEFNLLIPEQTTKKLNISKDIIRYLGKGRKEFLLEISFKEGNNNRWNKTIFIKNYFKCLAEML